LTRGGLYNRDFFVVSWNDLYVSLYGSAWSKYYALTFITLNLLDRNPSVVFLLTLVLIKFFPTFLAFLTLLDRLNLV